MCYFRMLSAGEKRGIKTIGPTASSLAAAKKRQETKSKDGFAGPSFAQVRNALLRTDFAIGMRCHNGATNGERGKTGIIRETNKSFITIQIAHS